MRLWGGWEQFEAGKCRYIVIHDNVNVPLFGTELSVRRNMAQLRHGVCVSNLGIRHRVRQLLIWDKIQKDEV